MSLQTYLEKRDPATNQSRYYHMHILPNLFGEWTLSREWGRIGHRGKKLMDLFTCEDMAIDALMTLEAAKRQRGYWVEPQQLAMFR